MASVEDAVADAHRRKWALVLATTARVARNLDLAEECVQEAYAAAPGDGRAGALAPVPLEAAQAEREFLAWRLADPGRPGDLASESPGRGEDDSARSPE